MPKLYDYRFKVLMVGDSTVGKTSILLRYAEGDFTPTFTHTIDCIHEFEIPAENLKDFIIKNMFNCIDFKMKTFEMDEKKIKLQIWDTAGQEKFRTITASFYQGAAGIMLIYDVTHEKSFDNLRYWITEIKESAYASGDAEMMILGNKCDLEDSRVVTKERGSMLAAEYGIKFFETSAKSDYNVKEAFLALAQAIKEKKDKLLVVPQVTVNVSEDNMAMQKGGERKPESSRCCIRN